MNTNTRQQCDPDSDPAEQPKHPGGECPKVPDDEPPELKEPEKCPPDPDCKCPAPPASSPSCLDDLWAETQKVLSEAESTNTFSKEVDQVRKAARTASGEYTQDKYVNLVKEWDRQDAEINEFIRKLICAVPCWRCLIECFVCPLIKEIRDREEKLWGDGTLYSEAHSLFDIRHWHDRNVDKKKRALDRIKVVLGVWTNIVPAIEKALADNEKLRIDLGKLLSSDATKVVYDVFLRLVPMHLVIAPPASSGYVTTIAKQYTQFCEFDNGEPDDCCGPDVGVLSVRRRLLGPQPYLVNPRDYFSVICCLAKERYEPAQKAYARAQSAWQGVNAEIDRLNAEIAENIKSIEKNAKAAFPQDCDWLKKPDESAL